MENLEGPKSGWSPVWGAKRLYTWTHLTVLFSFLTSPSVSGFFIKYKQQFPRASPSVQLSEVRNREVVSLGMGEDLWSLVIEEKPSALYWLSPVARSFQQDRLWWGDAKVLTLSHLLCSKTEHSCCRPDLQGSQLSVADERLVPICPATRTCLTWTLVLSLSTSAIYYCGQGTQEGAFCFLWEWCSALQCCDCARYVVFLWLASSRCFLTFLFLSKSLCFTSEAVVCVCRSYLKLQWVTWLTESQSLVNAHEAQGRWVVAAVVYELVQPGLVLGGRRLKTDPRR